MHRRGWGRSLINKAALSWDRFKILIIIFFATAALILHAQKIGPGIVSNGTTSKTWTVERNGPDQPHDIPFQAYEVQSPQGVSICGSALKLGIPCDDVCGNIAPLLNHLSVHGKNTSKPELYFVPLDGIALLRSSNVTLYEEVLKRTLDSVYNGYSFMRLGGASHVLLCLGDVCKNVLLDVVKLHPMGRKSRIIWVGRKGHMEGKDQWACPDRAIVAPDSLTQALGLPNPTACNVNENQLWTGVHDLLAILNIMFSGINRWQCGRGKWDLGDVSPSAGLVVDREHKLALCPIPKCGTTRLRMLLRRMTNQPNWDSFDGGVIHLRSGLEVVHEKEKLLELFQDPSWIKVAFVRHPAARLLSGYLNKIVYSKWYSMIDPKQKTEPSLQQVIDSLAEVSKSDRLKHLDEHVRPLQFFCGFKDVRYDFLGKTPSMGDDLKDLLSSLGLWETYGASGWGKNKSMSILEASVYKAPNHSGSKVDEMLSDKMLEQLFSIFHRDYELLDFKPLDIGA
ncbi:hypothetical protein BSKO_07697 [Bryopsis sp. KO-2023]|nr:hypothetical protein BSKO_07697 [Bryopsis sp. KO-2023]